MPNLDIIDKVEDTQKPQEEAKNDENKGQPSLKL